MLMIHKSISCLIKMANLKLNKNSAYVFSDIKSWSIKNGLKLNESKTECLHFVSRYRTGSSVSRICLDDGPIQCDTAARNLGVSFDNDLSRTHVNRVCKSASFALHKIGSIRRFLTKATAHRLVQALVMSRLDFCNSLLFCRPDTQIVNAKQCHPYWGSCICSKSWNE